MKIATLCLLAMLALAPVAKAQSSVAKFDLEISAPKLLEDLPSGSGMSVRDGRLFVVGDDSPWLYELDGSLNIQSKYQIGVFQLDASGRIPKALKPDFEAMSSLRLGPSEYQLFVGSGSKDNAREWGYLMSVRRAGEDGQPVVAVERFSLMQLYKSLKNVAGVNQINIEGLAVTDRQVIMMSRINAGKNIIFAVPLNDFVDYAQGRRKNVARIEAYPVRLPSVDGFEAGLSGAEYWPDRDSLVYTASVEATGDSYGDGAVLASFVGVIPLGDLQRGSLLDLRGASLLLSRGGRVTKTKAESIVIESGGLDQIRGVIVSDNDNGMSEFFRYALRAH